MAEALLRHHAGDRFEVYSAGLEPGQVNPLTVEVMKEVGIDISGHNSTPISDYLGKLKVDYAIAVCDIAEEACPVLQPFSENLLYWPFEDPASFGANEQEHLAKFREVRDLIDKRLISWIKEPSPTDQT
jgi:arsenate reductase